jgi:hypothetical protein
MAKRLRMLARRPLVNASSASGSTDTTPSAPRPTVSPHGWVSPSKASYHCRTPFARLKVQLVQPSTRSFLKPSTSARWRAVQPASATMGTDSVSVPTQTPRVMRSCSWSGRTAMATAPPSKSPALTTP